MNLTQETNDYFSTTDNIILKDRQINITSSITNHLLNYPEIEYCNANSGLKDKLKTTPDPAIKKITKIFRINWNKIFKNGK